MRRKRSGRRRDRWSESDVERKKACLLVAGTRTFDDYELLEEKLNGLRKKYDIRVLITGDATGVDEMAAKWANRRLPVGAVLRIHYKDGKKHGRKKAPVVRNTEMVRDLKERTESRLKIAVFFWDGKSPGTLDCLTKCRRAKVKRKVVRY